MKNNVSNIAVMATTLLICACQGGSINPPVTDTAINELINKQALYQQAQWPMFSGPNGNSQIEVNAEVATSWSVRQNKNLLWQTELPAGGQSGIAVWQDNVFFTINKPLDTPKYKDLVNEYEQAKLSYVTLFERVFKVHDQEVILRELSEDLTKKEEVWQRYFEQYQQMKLKKVPVINHERVIKKIKRQSKQWQAVVEADKAKKDYVHRQSKELGESYKKYSKLQKQLTTKGTGKDIVLYCISTVDGKVKWQKSISGVVDTMYNYAFSDATSPTPITDGKSVWVVNSTGGMASFTLAGEERWSRQWVPTSGRPFNKQYDTLLADELLFNVEPPEKNDNTRNPEWNYLHAFDKKTGKTQWVSSAALTHYNTPMLGKTVNDENALLIGRGGPHGVPEKSEGLSLLDMKGNTLWNWQAEQDGLVPWGATDIQIWNKNTALWFSGNKDLRLYSINAETGKTKRDYDLTQVSRHIYNELTQSYQIKAKTKTSFERQPYTPVLVGDALYYLVRYEPYIGYLNLTSGEHIQLEIPTEVDRVQGAPEKLIWKTMQTTDQFNSKGQRHNIEKRSQGDGTQKAFLASPIVINKKIYFTNAHGLTYVIDSERKFDEKALISVNDLGNKGETYSLSSMAYANGVLFQRSLKGIYAFTNM